jgi:hypothetical protein
MQVKFEEFDNLKELELFVNEIVCKYKWSSSSNYKVTPYQSLDHNVVYLLEYYKN